MKSRTNLRLLALLGISSAVHASALLAYGYLYNAEPAGSVSSASSRVSVVLNSPVDKPEPQAVLVIKPALAEAPLRPVITTVARSSRSQPVTARIDKRVEPAEPPQLLAPVMQEAIEPESVQVLLEKVAETMPSMPHTAPISASLEVIERQSLTASLSVADQSDAELDAAAELALSQQQLKQLQNQVGQQLLQAMTDYFRYPLKARRKGWQGEVLLRVELTEGGGVRQVELLQSSGYRVLDSAALVSMRQVETIAMASLSHALNVQVPVSYRIVN